MYFKSFSVQVNFAVTAFLVGFEGIPNPEPPDGISLTGSFTLWPAWLSFVLLQTCPEFCQQIRLVFLLGHSNQFSLPLGCFTTACEFGQSHRDQRTVLQ